MNKSTPMIVTALSLAVAVAALSFGAAAHRKKNRAEEEAALLRAQLALRPASPTAVDLPAPRSPDLQTGPIETNTVAELEAELAGLRAQLAATNNNDRPPRESWEDRMARMKAEDPEGYAEMIQRRQERQQEMKYGLAERTATFMDLDTSLMTDEERANHELLVEKMAAIWALTSKFEDPEAAPDRDAMRELFTQTREVRPLMDQERDVMFRQLAVEVGYEGAEAQAFAGYIDEIIEATTIRMPGGMPGGGPGRGDNADRNRR